MTVKGADIIGNIMVDSALAPIEGDELVRRDGLFKTQQARPVTPGTVQQFSFNGSASTTSTSFVNHSGGSFTFVAPVSGYYLVLWDTKFTLSASGDTDWQIAVTGATTATVAGLTSGWYTAWNFAGTPHARISLTAFVFLNAGSHTLQPQWKSVNGLTLAQIPSADGFNLTLISMGGTASVWFDEVKNLSIASSSVALGAGYTTISSGNTDGSFTVPTAGFYRLSWSWVGFNYNATNTADFAYSIDGGADVPVGVVTGNGGAGNDVLASARVALTAGTHTWNFRGKQNSGAITVGWTTNQNRFVFHVEGGAAVQSPQFVTPYRMAWASATTVTVAAKLGSVTNLLFSDGIVRSHTGTRTLNLAASGVDGRDTGVSQSASTLYSVWAIASGTDFYLVATTASPGNGGAPTGTAPYAYLGAFVTDGSSNILLFYQAGQKFKLAQEVTAFSTGAAAADQEVSLTGKVPLTASEALLRYRVEASSTSSALNVIAKVTGQAGSSYQGARFLGAGSVIFEIPTPTTSKAVRINTVADVPGTTPIVSSQILVMGWTDEYVDGAA